MNKLIGSSLMVLALQAAGCKTEEKAQICPEVHPDASAQIVADLRQQLLAARLTACHYAIETGGTGNVILTEDADRINRGLPTKRNICGARKVLATSLKDEKEVCDTYKAFALELAVPVDAGVLANESALSDLESTILKTQKYCPQDKK